MNISRKWLREFVDIEATDKEYDDTMTLAGQKVETTERMDAEIKNVVVARVLSMARHENSDHMWVCQVDAGRGGPIQIVTGAQNVHEGDLVPAALHNSTLPGGIHITRGKLRGVESDGMLCSYKELGLTQNDVPGAYEDGIWILNGEGCTVGEDINLVIGNDDSIVEFEITNNRPDCYSLLGLARETAAAFNVPMKHHIPAVKGGAEGSLPELLDVDIQADDLCLRYSARMVKNVKIAPSPKWMRQRLRSAGIRPINNIVDITNYVMVEYGQPMHAFDYRYVSGGKIIVRRAGEDKTLTTLDGNVRNLQPDMLVIADEHKPVGLAGIMGGENSEIVSDTVSVVFESANFRGQLHPQDRARARHAQRGVREI
jgi:phenylalanyl-tRNA synthetase beta chain